jgi:ABC-2 type transport system ATP-binding protein
MRTLLSLVLTTGVLALAPTTATGPQAAAAVAPSSTAAQVVQHQRYSTRDRMVTVHDGPGRTHETTIDTRLYRPKAATRKHPRPSILMTHGFGLTKDSAEVVNTAKFLARHGYAVLTYTSQGFGDSSGCVSLQSRTWDVKDAKQLITKVLARKPWVTHDRRGPVVGMVGGSYGGGIQANLAENDRRIRAIAPFRTWNTLQYSLDPNNYVVPGDPTGFTHTLADQGVFKKVWTSAFFASGQSQGADGTCSSDGAAGGLFPCGGFRSDVCQTFASVSATGDATDADRALLADSSATTQIDRLKVPVLLVQGQSDTLFNLNDAVATYTALRSRHVPVQMIWNSGGHGGYNSAPGECEPFDGQGTAKKFDHCYLPLRVLQFFDHYLKGKGPRGPGFSWFRDWKKYDGTGPTNVYAGARRFPLGGSTVFHLSGSEALVTSGAETGSATILNPPGGQPAAYTETPNFSGPDSSPQNTTAPSDVPGQFASFTSAPFARAVTSVGVPELEVALSHQAPTDLVMFAKVWDVAPDGSATLIHRLAAPARIPTAQLDDPVRIKLLGFAHRFPKGHSIRLTLCTTDQAYYNNISPDMITIATGAASRFVLPTS